jgi:hypothetical protein
MDEYGSMSEEDFKKKWSRDGKMPAATKIIKILRAENKTRDKKYVQLAKEEYQGDLFSINFSYQSNGRVLVLKDEHAIAKRYLHLKSKQI